ncbi:autotransporter domain-containing protein, partial [Acetobacter papayae]|uniref:autotransporter family protein n=1 Tax=Acetobacter papayae TaxID=1076592 RepID=UPI0039ECC786
QLGNGGTTGSVASSAIHNNGALVVNRSNALLLSGVIDGTGSLTQAGTGTTVLSADNTYTGATTITQGTLQLGNGGTTGSVASSAIHNNGALVVNRSNTLTLAQVIDGTGSLMQAGTGTTVLSADNTYTGATTVESGTLDVEGSIAASAVTVLSGSTLEGTGSVGSTLIEKGATLAPTGMTGVLSVEGNLEMADGATLSVHEDHHPSGTTMEVNGQTYDQLNSGTVAVTGTTALSGTLNVNVIPGTLLKSHEYYTLITSDGGFSSKADTLQSNLTNLYTFLSPSLYYTDNDLDLLMSRNDVTFSSVVGTRNERAVAQVLDSLPESNVLVQGMESLDAAEARQSMNAVSGEVYASARTALIQDSVYVRQAALDRLETADCQEGGMSGAIHTASLATGRKDEGCLSGQAVLWGEAYGGLGRNNGDGNAASMHHSTTGFIMGLDTPIMDGKWRIGGLFSYGRSMFDVGSGRGSSGHSNNITVGGYAGTHWGALSLKLGASYTWNMLSMQRNVAIADYASRQSSSYSGGTAQAFGELGYRFHTAYGTVEPFGNVAYVNLDTNGYQEEGGAAALQGRGTNTGVTFSTFGVKMFKSVQVGKLLLLPHGSLAYRRAFGLLTPTNHTMLASVGSGDMDVAGVALSQDSAVVDAGLNVRLTDRVDVGLSYIGQYGNQSVESGAMGRAHFRF